MPNCLSCGREMPSFSTGELHNVCPECRAAALARARAQAPAVTLRSQIERMPVTSAIVAINLLVFVAMTLSGVSPVMPQIPQLIRWGADFAPLTLTAQPWRILTSNYIHIGIIHIALNMWCLWNLGSLAERIFDRWTYFLTYTVCGLAGSLVSLWWHPLAVGAGASGAIFGMAGVLISALYLGRLPVPASALKATLKSLLSFAAYNLFFGAVVPGIDNSAHFGGLVAGLILGAVLAPRLTSPLDERNSWRGRVFIVAGIVLLLAFYVVRQSVMHTTRGVAGLTCIEGQPLILPPSSPRTPSLEIHSRCALNPPLVTAHGN